jgi:ABC-type sugar transport system ATPase subunit
MDQDTIGATGAVDVHVQLRDVSKVFGGVTALRNIDLDIERGRIHALVGENGAGKSTLGRLLAGVHQPSTGSLRVDGGVRSYGSPRAALADGITMIAQELMLVPSRTVLENVFLGSATSRLGVVQQSALRRRFEELSESIGFNLAPHALVGSLRLADRQKVEILRALARRARLIVMDEPTAALTGEEADRLLDTMRTVRAAGTSVVFVSHFLRQVLDVSDTVTVLRDGRLIRTSPAAGETPDSLVDAMLGRSLAQVFPVRTPPPAHAPVVLSVRGLGRRGAVSGVDLDVRAGEIVGLAGLVGAGRTELVRTIFGAERAHAGEILVDGKRRRIRSPRDAVRAGLAMVPESRRDQGLFLSASIRRNVSLPHLRHLSTAGVLSSRRERAAVAASVEEVGVRGALVASPVAVLSGGNQQKTIFARWLLRRPRVLIADEPTRGVDIGSKQTIYELLKEQALEGMAVLFVSSELDEVMGLAHRILVMRGGRIVAEMNAADATETEILQAAFGIRGTA